MNKKRAPRGPDLVPRKSRAGLAEHATVYIPSIRMTQAHLAKLRAECEATGETIPAVVRRLVEGL